MELIIKQLLTSNTVAIKQATTEFNIAMQQNPNQAILDQCKILTSPEIMPAIRQYSAILLRKHLRKRRNYEQISSTIKNLLKTNMLNIIFQEKEKLVRGAITNFFACILQHESRHNDTWVNEVIQHILTQCYTNESEINEVGCFVLAKLAEETPAPFVKHFSIVGQLIKVAILQTDAKITLTMLSNILITMDAMLPVINGNKEAESTYEAALPILLKIINKFATENLIENFNISLEVLEDMVEYTPKLLKSNFPLILEFLLNLGSQQNYNEEIRIKALNIVSQIVRDKKKLIIKLKLIEPIIIVIFNIMSIEPESNNPNEFFDRNDDNTKDTDTTLEAAKIVMDTMAIYMPPEKFLPPLLLLLEPALKNTQDILRRRAAYIVLSTISEGCHESISNKYLEPMINILKQGLNDIDSRVRNAALLAVGQFSEQLQPKISKYGKDIIPVLLKYMEDIITAYEHRQQQCIIEEKQVERVFYALEAFCDSMAEDLAPFMENLMTMIFRCWNNHNDNSNLPQHLQISAMALIEAIAKAYKGSLLPWFQLLIEKLKPIIMSINNNNNNNNNNNDIQINDKLGIRALSLNILAALVRNINKEFQPYAKETIKQCLQWFELRNDDPDIKSGLLDVFGAISSINGEELKEELSFILKYIEICIEENKNEVDEAITSINDLNNKMDIDNSTSEEDNEESTSLESHYLGENPYLQLKEQAIYTLKEIIENCPQAMLNYYEKFFNILYNKNLQHDSIEVCIASITAMKTLVIKWYEQFQNLNLNSILNIKQNIEILMKKLLNIISKDKSSDVVIRSLESLGEIIKINLPTKELCNSIVESIKDGLNYKYKCQCCDSDNDNNNNGNSDNNNDTITNTGTGDGDVTENHFIDSEIDKAIIEASADLLVSLSKVISMEDCLIYFKILEPLIFKHIQHATFGNLQQSTRAILIGILAECYQPLDIHVKYYFEKHFNMLINAAIDSNEDIRQISIFGLGELVRAAQNVSYDYFPIILETLSKIIVNEKKIIVIEHIVGTLARLILTNYNLIPLDQVLPVIFDKLPINDEIENNVVKECCEMLKNIMPERMNQYISNVIQKKKL